MSRLFLSEYENSLFKQANSHLPMSRFYWALLNRVQKRTSHPGLMDQKSSQEWWHVASELLTDAAMVCAIKPDPQVCAWTRDVTLSLIRRPEEDWVGPPFRDPTKKPAKGHLETAHLSWAVAIALDLARNVFSESEQREIEVTLRERAIPLCLRWMEECTALFNWRCVMTAGYAVPAAVLNDRDLMAQAARDFMFNGKMFQQDGSYGESLQYENYAASTQMLTYEALVRRDPELKQSIHIDAYAPMVKWAAYSHFYNKPLAGWGGLPRPRSANFNDSAAMFKPSGDLLLHISARSGADHQPYAGLARWLFDTLYTPYVAQEPSDLGSFGFYNCFGFLTLPLLSQAKEAMSPETLKLPLVAGFDCGDMFARDAWNGRTILAVHSADQPLCASAHTHYDLNSFILVHNQERFLVDPGHSCYRGLIHGMEVRTATHNTCTFSMTAADGSQKMLEQNGIGARRYEGTHALPPVDRLGKRLICEAMDEISVLGADVAASYGAPLTQFSRFWISAGAHVLYVVDLIESSEPVATTWNWLLNNRDGTLDLKLFPDRLVARRGDAGMKLFHLAGGVKDGPNYAFVHDCYNPRPAQPGEGQSGSGMLLRWRETKPERKRAAIHMIALDDYGQIAGWHLKTIDAATVLESPGATQRWSLSVNEHLSEIILREEISKRVYAAELAESQMWTLTKRA